ncbi:Serine/threonine-protein kinase YPK2/YKR2 [Yarrowia sp. C11]|nr:Serine/threonine-protein kinase YPK2/YKR2 [Yarrowia sp. C11]
MTWNLTKKLKETTLSSFGGRSSSQTVTNLPSVSTKPLPPQTQTATPKKKQERQTEATTPTLKSGFANKLTISRSQTSSKSHKSHKSQTTVQSNHNSVKDVTAAVATPVSTHASTFTQTSADTDSATAATATTAATIATSTIPTTIASSGSIENSTGTGTTQEDVRSATPFQKPHHSPSVPAAGVLDVSIFGTEGLSLPDAYKKYSAYFEEQDNGGPPPVYLVLEFDKTQLLLEPTGGTALDCPVWNARSSFDVSRTDEGLAINIYAKLPTTLIQNEIHPLLGRSSALGDEKSTNTVLDVFLGCVRVRPALTHANRSVDGWCAVSSGTGRLKITVDFKPTPKSQSPLSMQSFELLKVLGKGTFGKVMMVRKKDTHQIYAIKSIYKHYIISTDEVAHTLAERTVLAQIRNPFIVPLKFSFQSPEKLYLGLAFVNGGELFYHLQRERFFDLNRARFYTAELLCALECLHDYNIVYRDLKPENILLDYMGHIVLCDFGLCKLNMTSDERTNTRCGTPEYMSPEILLNKGYTKSVDWWTLGVLLYEMLTGLPPFYSDNHNKMYQRILKDPLRFPQGMDPTAVDIITGLLQREPSERLGAGGAQEIKAHPFFKDIDWNRLLAKKYSAPFKPRVLDPTDTSNFDRDYTSMVPQDSFTNDYLSDSVQKQFGGWTYLDQNVLH